MAQFELKISEVFDEDLAEFLPIVIMRIDHKEVIRFSTEQARNAGLMMIQAAQGADDQHYMIGALQQVGVNDGMIKAITELYQGIKADDKTPIPQGAQEITCGERDSESDDRYVGIEQAECDWVADEAFKDGAR
jgi:hypothetical protein